MTTIVKDNGNRKLPYEPERMERYIWDKTTGLKLKDEDVQAYIKNIHSYIQSREQLTIDEVNKKLIMDAEAFIDIETANWDKVAERIFLHSLYKSASKQRFYDSAEKYGSYLGLVTTLVRDGIFSETLVDSYTKEEIMTASAFIEPERDLLFTYAGLNMLSKRYLVKTFDGESMELPQERFLTIALYLMQNEPKDVRLSYVKSLYDALSKLQMTVATPTLANAGHTRGQLSSCFITSPEDSLDGIYQNEMDLARVSKWGGGIGSYFGFLRSNGASIRGIKNAARGIVPWAKGLNNIAVSVDQLGTRSGAINISQDVFHKDIFAFLDLRLNNGDDRMRARDIFTTVNIPDLFMETVEKRGEWYLFDPHEVKSKKGWYLQDFYDEKRGEGSFREKYQELVEDNNIEKEVVKAIDIFKSIMRAQLEGGTPFMFYRDTANRLNPNKHAGIIYATNLCTEISQNLSPSSIEKRVIDGNTVVTYEDAGDMVVCNLSSLNLAKVAFMSDKELEKLVDIQFRALDNTIDLNELPVERATITNNKYRAVNC